MTGLPARQWPARMGLQAEAPAVRGNHQRFSTCRVHTLQRRPRQFHQRHVRVSCLEIWNGLSVSAHSAAGLSGCAPCRLRCHGHSASIPHAFAPAALRASLASRGKPCGLSPPRSLAPLDAAEPAAPGRPGQRLAAMGGTLANTLALAAAGCAVACRPQRWRFLPITSRRTVHGQPARHRYGASAPRLKTGAARCGVGVLACRRVVDLARVSGRAGKAFGRGCRVGPISFRSGSAQGVLVSL